MGGPRVMPSARGAPGTGTQGKSAFAARISLSTKGRSRNRIFGRGAAPQSIWRAKSVRGSRLLHATIACDEMAAVTLRGALAWVMFHPGWEDSVPDRSDKPAHPTRCCPAFCRPWTCVCERLSLLVPPTQVQSVTTL